MAITTKEKGSRERLTGDKYFNLIEHAADGIAIIQDGVFKLVNTALCRIAGYDKGELLGMPFTQLLTPASQKLTMARYQARLAGKKVPPVYEIQAVTKDGEIRDIEINAALAEYEGRIADEVIVRDITERKQVEEALQQSNRRFTDIAENALEWIWEVDARGKYTYASPVVEEILGYKPEEVLEKHFYDLFHPDDREELKKAAFEAFAQKQPFRQFVNRNIHKNGEIVWLSTSGVPILDEEGNLVGYRGADVDITERKQAEEALRESEEEKNTIIEEAPAGICHTDLKGIIKYVNKRFEEESGYSREEIIGKNAFKLGWFSEGTLSHFMQRGVARLRGKPHKYWETQFKRKDGTWIWVTTEGKVIKKLGVPVGFQILANNITERKRAEEELKLRAQILDSATDEIHVHDDDDNFIYVNEAACRPYGYSREKFMKMKLPQIVDPERARPLSLDRQELLEKGHIVVESAHLRKDGSVVPVEVHARVIESGGRKIFITVARDITERKQAEEALQAEKNKLQSVIDALADGLSIQDKDYNIIYQSEPTRIIFGDHVGEKCYRAYEGRDKICHGCPVEKAFKDGKSHTSERKLVTPSGEVTYLENKANPIRDARGEIVSCLEIGRDITERKKAEEELRESENKYKTIFENVSEVIIRLDKYGKIVDINGRSEECFGYKPEEVIGKNFANLGVLSLKDLPEIIRGKREPFILELKAKRKDGSPIIIEVNSTLVKKDGKAEGFVTIVRDITERKQMEEALQAERNKLQSVIGAMEYDLTIQDKDFNIIYQNEPSRISSGGDHLGEKCYRAYEGKDKVCHGCPVKKAFKDGKSHTTERKRLSPSGEVTFFENTANPIRDARGEIVSCLEIGRDITARKQMEHQLQEKNEQLDAQNEELRAINEELQATEEELQQSQEKLERMFESVTEGIIVATLDGTILKVNEKAVQMHGFASEDEMLGKNAFELIAPVDHERIAGNIRKALKEGATRYQEYTLLKADGSEFPGELSTSALKDGWGNLIGHISVARDITERKQMEELFKTVTSSSPVGIYIMQDRKFQMANPQFQKLTGYTKDELAGMDFQALVLDEDRDQVREKAIKMLKGELFSPYQFRVVNKAGETRWVMETVTSIQYRGRRAILGNYMDITERRQAEEKERRLQQELNLAGRLASIGQLAAGVAHEINNPLTGVIGFSHLLLGRDIPDDMKQDIQVINSEAQRVSKIVENLLTFAHQRKTGREYVDINNIIARVLELRAYEMKVNNIEVETRLAPDLPQTMADAGQFQQVFLNIVLNAEHFMTTAHNRGKLLVKTERIDGNIRASFTDDGTGISQENLDKIFNPFFTTKEVGSGTGLGLSICHGIIAQHSGRIYAQSKLGQGATFVIELPIVEAPIPAERVEVTKKESQKPRGAKILVVDDEAAILTFLSRLLTEWGHSVKTLNNANSALEKLKTERYSLILLDIKLPGMSGIELYQHIEEIAPALTRRVIFITGDVMEPATRQFLDKAKVPHIIKPLDIEVLKKAINSALNQTRVAAGK